MLWIMDQNRLGQYPRPFPKGIHPDRSQCWLESSPHKGLPVRMQLLHTIFDDAYFPNFITKTMRRTLSLLFGCWWQAVQRQVVWKLLWCWYWLWALLWTSTWMLSTGWCLQCSQTIIASTPWLSLVRYGWISFLLIHSSLILPSALLIIEVHENVAWRVG